MKRLACILGGSSSTAKKAAEFLMVVAALLALTVPLFSQGAVGTILGAVFDSTGGAIAGATVTITDVARGTTRVLTTDASGQWTAPSLLAGTYSVRAEFTGFQSVEQADVLLEVAQSVRVDLKLSPGAQTQTVTITGEAPAINSTDATLGGTITNQAVSSLPLETRNFLQLLQLRPGIVDVPGGTGTATTTNGRREGADVLLIEGITQFDMATSNVLINGAQKGGAVDELPLDSIQEFSTQQSPQAEYGWRDGSAINLAVKSGTNGIHGSAYAFGRDAAATDAKNFSALPGPESVSNLTIEQPGFTLGGPLVKDKLFWFVSAEFFRQSSNSTAGVTVPADLTMVGSPTAPSGCSALLSTGNCAFSMVDACHDLLLNGTTISPVSAQISGLNPANCAFISGENLWPSNPTNSPIIFPNPATTTPSNNGLAKVDYSPNEKHHFDGFVFISRETTAATSGLNPLWSSLGIGSTEEYAGAWTYTPNSSWVNDLRGGAAPNYGNSVPQDVNMVPANPYPSGYGVNTGASGFGLMCINVGGIFSSTSGLGDCGKNGIRGPQYQLDFTDKVSYLHGNHAFKWGYEQVFVHFDDSSTASQSGFASFTSLETFLGAPGPTCPTCGPTVGQGNIIVGNNTDQWREQWHAAFFQDTWRVSRKITLTPGIRFEYIGSPHSIINKMGTFDPNQPGGAVQVGPGLTDSSTSCLAQNVACESTVTHPQKTDFNPRMGVAWDIAGNGRTVLRGGITNLSSFPTVNAVAGNQVPFGDTLCNSGTNVGASPAVTCPAASIVLNRYGSVNNSQAVNSFSLTPIWTCGVITPLPAGCTATTIFPSASLANSTSGATCGTSLNSKTNPLVQCSMLVSNPNLQNPKSLQWNLDLQRAITNKLTLDVAYVGTHGYNEIHTIDLNEAAIGSGWDASALLKSTCIGTTGNAVIGPGAGGVFKTTCAADMGGTLAGPAATGEQASRPYNLAFPYFANIAQTTNGFRSNYKALQVTLDSRNFHGLSFLTAYTYSHAQDDWTKSSQATFGLANPANPQYQYGNSDQDVRHRLRFSPTYTIPGIKSPGQMLEGWQISGIWAWQTGFAWAPQDATKNDWSGTGENLDTGIPSPNSGEWQTWNYSGPKSAFSNAGDTPIPCYGGASGCTAWATINATNPAIWQTCSAAAVAPYGNQTENVGGTTVALSELALAALTSSRGACYIQKGGILTPPAYGTLGNGNRGMFTGPNFLNVDMSLQKIWKFREKYSAQFRFELYNVFNHVNYAQFSDGASDPSGGGGVISGGGTFGFATTAQGNNRQMQFGLKFLF
jgi:Carboxypeptidase regulatory-like domain